MLIHNKYAVAQSQGGFLIVEYKRATLSQACCQEMYRIPMWNNFLATLVLLNAWTPGIFGNPTMHLWLAERGHIINYYSVCFWYESRKEAIRVINTEKNQFLQW